MTGYTVHTGSTEEFSEGWDRIFGKGSSASKKGTKGVAKKTDSKPETSSNAAAMKKTAAAKSAKKAARKSKS
ncbi:MAG: hypothetical protein C0478_05965 [Planctomyces sp.]|jgi:hypothetical protein|nr:hypothetical protein [Planctomyces sp.]